MKLTFKSLLLLLAFCSLLPTSSQAQPAPSRPITLNPKFSPDPMRVDGISGGLMPINRIAGRPETANGPCVGFANERPHHTLVLTSPFNYLSLQVESAKDTTLLIQGPGGTWCNDDVSGKNPGLAGQWLPGTYGVWVGSFQKGQSYPYTLEITEVR